MLHTGAEHLYYALRSFSQDAYTAKPVWNSPPAITEYRQNTTPNKSGKTKCACLEKRNV